MPQLPHGTVLRPRLMDTLSNDAAVTLVSAGPGWGKTMLVAAWAATLPPGRPVAWLSLDSFDDDPVLFWSYLTSAIQGTGEMPGELLDTLAIRPPVGSEVVRRIILAMAELPRRLTLVLDDLGQIHNPAILDGVGDLIRHAPKVQVVLISRSDPPLHLHRLRVEGELVEIRAADLAFTEPESVVLLAGSGLALPPDLVTRLQDRTEGWAAGLRLAALFAVGQRDVTRIEEFADATSGVAGYFLEEVLAALSPERLRFMLRTSVAERLCADLADVLSEGRAGQQQLESLEHDNAFVVALDAQNFWFRYHPLLAEMLRHRLTLDDPDLAAELHRRAARWFTTHGHVLEGVRHAVQACDWQLVGELMLGGAIIRALAAERLAFAAVLAEVPARVIDSSPELRATAAVGCFIAHDYDGFALHVAHARSLLSRCDPASRRPIDVFLCAADMVVSRVTGDMPALIAATTQLLAWLKEPSMSGLVAATQFEAPALTNLGVALAWTTRFDEAEHHLKASLSSAAVADAGLVEVNSMGFLALVELERGHLESAYKLARRGLDVAEFRGWTELGQLNAIYLTLAQVALERNDVNGAQKHLDAGFAAHRNDPERLGYPALQAVQARVWLAGGQKHRARQVIASMSTKGGPPLPPLQRRWLAVVAAEADLAAGRAQAARDRVDIAIADDVESLELRFQRARARLALGDAEGAETDLAGLRDAPGNPLISTQAWLTTALAADHERDDLLAMTALECALVAAEPENLRRPFVTLGDSRLAAMLRQRATTSEPGTDAATAFAASLVDEIDPTGRVSVVITPLVEPLSDRELVVLAHMATHQTNGEIAADLFISINTVKAHARAVYRKLDVPNRREAIRRARELGLA